MNEPFTELEKANVSLRRSEQRFARLFLDHPAPMAITTIRDGRIINVNTRLADLVGYHRDEIIGKTVNEIGLWVNPNERAQVIEQLNLEGVIQNHVTKMRCRSGELRDVMLSVEIIEIEGETEPAAIWMANDITELKRTEELLRTREQEISAIADNIPGLVNYIDSEGRLRYANELHKVWFGTPRSQIMGKHYSQVFDAAASERIKNAMGALRAGKSVQYEAAHPWARPTPRWAFFNYVPDLDDQGKLKGFFMLGIDITERKHLEEALRESEAKLKQAQQLANIGYWERDVAADRIIWSEGTRRIFGLGSRDNIHTQAQLQELIYPDDRQIQQQALSEALRGSRLYDVEYRIVRLDGDIRFVHVRDEIVYDDSHTPIHMFGTVQDITERKQAEEQIRQYSARLQTLSNQLLAAQEQERRTIARELHDEIGQVVTAVSTGLQGIRHARNRATRTKRLNETIALVDKTWNRIRALALDLRPSILDDFGLVAALDWYLKQQAERSGFKATLVVELPPIRFEPNLETTVFRVAQIALTNVARHAHAKHVAVELRLRAAHLEIVIRDDGVGFDVPLALDRAAHGESMGLSSLQERVRLVRGELEIQSSTGQGTQVWARFPIPGKEMMDDENKYGG